MAFPWADLTALPSFGLDSFLIHGHLHPLVELSTLEAMAYRQGLRRGRSGVVILRRD
jgi:hypothetical protein